MAKVLPAPLTHGGSGDTPVYLRSSGSRARKAGAGPLGARGRPGGRGGRRPGRVQYWRGKEQHCTASRPSRPPGARDPAPHRLQPDQPQNRGCAGELGPPWRPETWRLDEGGGDSGGVAGGEIAVARKAALRHPAVARACSLNTRSTRRGAVAMVTRVPATGLNGCCLATPEQAFWDRPLRCSRFPPRAGGGLPRPSGPRAPPGRRTKPRPSRLPPGLPAAPRPRGPEVF